MRHYYVIPRCGCLERGVRLLLQMVGASMIELRHMDFVIVV